MIKRIVPILLILSVMLSFSFSLVNESSYAEGGVSVTKEWEDGLTGSSAANREVPTVNLEGTVEYSQLLNMFFPVGTYYETQDGSFNPNETWGGTWEKETEGYVHIGAGDSYTINATGGSKTVTLNTNQLPSHRHQQYYTWSGSPSIGGNWKVDMIWSGNGGAGTWTHSSGLTDVGAVGGNGAHNNMMPYTAVNRWHRIA